MAKLPKTDQLLVSLETAHNKTSNSNFSEATILATRDAVLAGHNFLPLIESRLAAHGLRNEPMVATTVENYLVNWTVLFRPRSEWEHLLSSILSFSWLTDTMEKFSFSDLLKLILKDAATQPSPSREYMSANELSKALQNFSKISVSQKTLAIQTLLAMSDYYLFRYLEQNPAAIKYLPKDLNTSWRGRNSILHSDFRLESHPESAHPVVERLLKLYPVPHKILLRQLPSSSMESLSDKLLLRYLFNYSYQATITDLTSLCKQRPHLMRPIERILCRFSIVNTHKYLQFCQAHNLTPRSSTERDLVYIRSLYHSAHFLKDLDTYIETWLSMYPNIPLEFALLKRSSSHLMRLAFNLLPDAYPIPTLTKEPHATHWLLHPHAISYVQELPVDIFTKEYPLFKSEIAHMLNSGNRYNTADKQPPLTKQRALELLSSIRDRANSLKLKPAFTCRWESIEAARAAGELLNPDAATHWLRHNIYSLTESSPSADLQLVLRSIKQ